jgi:hypothetical protein
LGKPSFIAACQTLALTDPDDSVRTEAIASFGKAHESTRDPFASQFLASISKNTGNTQNVRAAAYWALRVIQMGVTEEDLVKGAIRLVKLAASRMPTKIDEKISREILLADGRFPTTLWNTADEIDWDYVNQYAAGQ